MAEIPLLVLVPTLGETSAVVDRALAELRDLGIAPVAVDLRSEVGRLAKIGPTDVDPLARRLAATAAHELAGDIHAKVGFLGGGSLAAVAAGAGALTARTGGLIALFPDLAPLQPATVPTLVVADTPISRLTQLQDAWGEAASIVLAPRELSAYEVRGIADPVSALVADFAARELLDRAVRRGLGPWLASRGWDESLPLTSVERRRLVKHLAVALEDELAAAGRALTPVAKRRVGRVAVLLAGLLATQLAAGTAPAQADLLEAAGSATFSNGELDLAITLQPGSWNSSASTLNWVTSVIGCSSNVVHLNGAPVTGEVACDQVQAIDLLLNGNAHYNSVQFNLDGFNAGLDLDIQDSASDSVGVDINGGNGNDHLLLGVDGDRIRVDVDAQSGADILTIKAINAETSDSIDVAIQVYDGGDTIRVGDLNAIGYSADVDLDVRVGTTSAATGDLDLVIGDLLASDSWASVDVDVVGAAGADVVSIGNVTAEGYSADVDISFTGNGGDDEFVVGDLLASGSSAVVSLDFSGSGGDDLLQMGNASAIGDWASVSISADGSVGNDQFTAGNLLASGYNATVSLSFSGDSGTNVLRVGNLTAQGSSASVSVDLSGGASDDELVVGDLLASGTYADISVSIDGYGGADTLRVGDGLAEGNSASIDISLDGSGGDDQITVGSMEAREGSSSDAYVSLSIDGGTGDDQIDIGRLFAGTNGDVDLSITLGDGSDLLTLQSLGGSGNGELSIDVSKYYNHFSSYSSNAVNAGNDVVRLLGTDLGVDVSVDVMINGGSGSSDTFSYASAVAGFVDRGQDTTDTAIRLLNFESFVPIRSASRAPSGPLGSGVGGEGSATTDRDGKGATAEDPISASIRAPAGAVRLQEGAPTEHDAPATPGATYSVLGFKVDVHASEATPENPIELSFEIDASQLTGLAGPGDVRIFRNGRLVAVCASPGVADPDPCVSSRSVQDDGDLVIVVLTSKGSTWIGAVPDEACPVTEIPASEFGDVASSPHADAIGCVAWWDVTEGVASGVFDPVSGVTRAQMASFLARVIDQAQPGRLATGAADAFSDDDNSVHEAAIDRLAAAGLVFGTADGRFDPTAAVSRGQMASFLARTVEYLSGETLAAGTDAFGDDDATTHEASINKIAAAEVADGTTATTFDPTGSVKRGQMAAFLTRMLNLLVVEGDASPRDQR